MIFWTGVIPDQTYNERVISRENIVEASSLLIQEGYGAERATAPSPNNYEMIEKLGYLISLLSTVAPLQKNP